MDWYRIFFLWRSLFLQNTRIHWSSGKDKERTKNLLYQPQCFWDSWGEWACGICRYFFKKLEVFFKTTSILILIILETSSLLVAVKSVAPPPPDIDEEDMVWKLNFQISKILNIKEVFLLGAYSWALREEWARNNKFKEEVKVLFTHQLWHETWCNRR